MLTEQHDTGVCTLTLERADKGNALSDDLVVALTDAVARVLADAAVHTIVFRGAGRHFCTGFDLGDLEHSTDADLLARFVRVELLLAMIWHAPLRTIAIGSGRTWGAGADLLAACEVRLALAGTTCRFPGAAFGLVLGTRRLAQRVGADHARDWVAMGREIDAESAVTAGLLTQVVEPGALAAALQSFSLPPGVDRVTAAALRSAALADHRDADLAALVRSAARPGLKARIEAYRQAQLLLRQAPAQPTT